MDIVRLIAISLLPAFVGTADTTANRTIRTAAELAQAVFDAEDLDRPFEIEATVTYVNLPRIMFKDATGGMYADDKRNVSGPTPPQPGDLIRLSGHIILSDTLRLPVADCQRIVQLSHSSPLPPQRTTIAEVSQGKFDYQLVSVIGEIADSIRDDIDRNYRLLVLTDGDARIIVPVQTSSTTNDFGLSIIGRRIEATGVCDPVLLGGHKNLGRGILPLPQTGLRELPAERHDPFHVPDLGRLTRRTAQELLPFERRRITGTVLAVYGDENGILSCAHERIVRVSFAEAHLPPVGACIEVSGFPFTDSYTPCLGRALWHPSSRPADVQPTPLATCIRDILTTDGERHEYNWKMHGRPIRLKGTVISLPASAGNRRQFYLGDGNLALPVVVDALTDADLSSLLVNVEVEVTGICVIETGTQVPGTFLPHVTNATLVLCRPEDLVILRAPPWWTPRKFLSVIVIMTIVLCVIAIWNIALHRVSERRGREIAASDLAQAKAALKTFERTRLAVELHDSISQNLTGAAMELKTADLVADTDLPTLHRLLALAIRTLDASRENLRNCIWDLRNLALDEDDINAAIQRTVAPHVGDTTLSIHFRAPREHLSDNTVHTILSIIRELAVNAVRHGKATAIWIDGNVQGGKLLFSVRDNGCGFDVMHVPSMAQGHFGLQGIRDRISFFEGKMHVSSQIGKGTKVTLSLNMPHEKKEN